MGALCAGLMQKGKSFLERRGALKTFCFKVFLRASVPLGRLRAVPEPDKDFDLAFALLHNQLRVQVGM